LTLEHYWLKGGSWMGYRMVRKGETCFGGLAGSG